MHNSISEHDFSVDFGPVNLKNWLSGPKNWLPKFVVLLKDVFE
jgi:hypothetical protein